MENILDRSVQLGEFIPEPDDDRIVCRCEEVTKGEIRRAVHDGMFTITEIRRYVRVVMIVTGYTDENGTVIPEEDATEYIWKQARNNEEDKTWLLEYMWDVFTGNPKFKKELEELKEARFDDVCSVKEVNEQGNVIPYNGEYEPDGR